MGQHEDERIIVLARKHPFFLLLSMLVPAVILLAGLALPIFLSAVGILNLNSPQELLRSSLIICLALSPLILLLIFFAYWEWENDLYILTNKRVISQKKVLRLSEHWHEAELSKIQDITTTVPNFLAHLLDYADMDIATASATGSLRFAKIPRPDSVKEEILRQQEIVLGLERERRRQEMRFKLAEEFDYGPASSPSD